MYICIYYLIIIFFFFKEKKACSSGGASSTEMVFVVNLLCDIYGYYLCKLCRLKSK